MWVGLRLYAADFLRPAGSIAAYARRNIDFTDIIKGVY